MASQQEQLLRQLNEKSQRGVDDRYVIGKDLPLNQYYKLVTFNEAAETPYGNRFQVEIMVDGQRKLLTLPKKMKNRSWRKLLRRAAREGLAIGVVQTESRDFAGKSVTCCKYGFAGGPTPTSPPATPESSDGETSD